MQIYKNTLENKCSDIFWHRISRIFFGILEYYDPRGGGGGGGGHYGCAL